LLCRVMIAPSMLSAVSKLKKKGIFEFVIRDNSTVTYRSPVGREI